MTPEAQEIARSIKGLLVDLNPGQISSPALAILTHAENLANLVLLPNPHLTMGDAIRASHPGAGRWMEEITDLAKKAEDRKKVLDRVAEIVQSHFTGKPGAMDALEDLLKKQGYTIV